MEKDLCVFSRFLRTVFLEVFSMNCTCSCLLWFLFLAGAFSAFAGDDPQFTVVKEGNKKGLSDENGKTVIPIRYDDLGWSQGRADVYHKVIGYREGSLWGLIDVSNEKVCEPLFYHLIPYTDRLLIASRRMGKSRELVYGLINTRGEQEQAFRYLRLTRHHDQLIATVAKGQQPAFGVIDQRGRAVLGFQYSSIRAVAPARYAVHRGQQAALFTTEGEALTAFRYDSISQFRGQLAITYQRGRQGLIDRQGKERLPNQYQTIEITDDRTVWVMPFRQWKAYTQANKVISTYSFEDFQPVGVNLYRVKIGTAETFVDSQGEVVVPERWQVARLHKKFAVLTDHGKYGVLRNDTTLENRIVVPIEYDSVRVDHHYIVAGKKGIRAGNACFGWQLFDQRGKLLSPYTYQAVGDLSEQLFAVKRKNHWGYADTTGQEVIACQYLAAAPFADGRASVDFIDGQGVIDTAGRWVVKPFKRNGAQLHLSRVNDALYLFRTEAHRYESPQYGLIDQQGHERYQTTHELIDNGHSVWERDESGRYGLISYTGQRLLETRYDTVSGLQEEKIYVYERDGKFGILSRKGDVLQDLDNNFEELHAMSGPFLGVKINGKYGFVDTWGRLRIANRYDSVTRFQHQMAAVKMLGRWGYVDQSERLVVQPHFDRAYPFRGKVAIVMKKGKYGMVNTRGRSVVPAVYDRIVPTEAGRYLIYRNDPQRGTLVGLVSAEGRPLIHPKYESVDDLGNGYVIVSRNEKYGLLTVEGRPTIPMIHPKLVHDPYNELYLTVTQPSGQKITLD